MKRWRALGFLAIAACAATPPTTPATLGASTADTRPSASAVPSDSRRLDGREQAALDRLVGATERARDLTFHTAVRAFVESPEAIARHADSELDETELAEASLLYRGLGLLPADLDLRAHLRALLGEQVLGYYDPERARLVLRDEVAHVLATRPGSPSAMDARLVVVHELTHALQAQRLGLAELHERERPSDAEVAFHSVVEGDAMLAMLVDLSLSLDVPLEQLTTDQAIDALAAGAASGGNDALLAAPAIVRTSLVAPYVAGLRFVRTLHARGGWRAIDDAFAHLPTSMEQVLHPEAYLRGELPEPITLPAFAALEAEGFEPVDEDTLGELELSVFLARGTARDLDAAAASGWAGDRLRLYRRGDEPAIVWSIHFDDEHEAVEAERALRALRDPLDRFLRRGRALLVQRHVPDAIAIAVEAQVFADAPPDRDATGSAAREAR